MFFEEGCREKLAEIYGGDLIFDQAFLTAASKPQILLRMLANLKAIYLSQQDFGKALPIIEKILFINPDSPTEVRDRGIAHYKLNHLSMAVRDWSRYLELSPPAEDLEAVKNNVRIVGQLIARNN